MRPGTRQREIQDFLLSEAASGRHPVLREVALRFNAAIMTVSKARRQLISAGLLPEPPRSSRGGRPRRPITLPPVEIVSDPGTIRPSRRGAEDGVGAEPGAEPPASDVARVLPPGMVRDILAAATGPALSLDEQRERLSWLAQNAAREEVQISALSTLARLDAMAGVRSGPSNGAVLTEEDAIDHLSLLMKANGKARTDAAYHNAFSR